MAISTLSAGFHADLPIGVISPWPGVTAPPGWLLCAGQAVSRTEYAELFQVLVPKVGTADFSGNPSMAVPTVAGHGLQTGDAIFFTTTGTLPSPLVPNTIYYVGTTGTNYFHVVTERGNTSGVAISTTGSGVHTVYHCPYGLGDGSTTFNLPDLRGRTWVGLDNLGGTDAGRLDLPNAVGLTGGSQKVTLTTAEMPSHLHSIAHNHPPTNVVSNGNMGFGGVLTWDYLGGGSTLAAYAARYPNASNVSNQFYVDLPNYTGNSGSAGSGQPHENMPPFMLGGWIIKARHVIATRPSSKIDPALGPLLAMAQHEPASQTSVSENSNVATAVHANLVVNFTMPSTGAVLVEMTSLMGPSTLAETYWTLLDASNNIISAATTWMVGAANPSFSMRQTYRKRMTGTPGANITYKWAFFRGPGGAAATYIYFGGSYGPAIMTVHACP